MQKLTLDTLDRCNIKKKQEKPLNFNNIDKLEEAALYYAEQLNPLYQQFAERVASGIRTRRDSTGIYAHAMAVIIEASDEKLINGLNINEIFNIANQRQPRIQKGNLRVVLSKIEELQLDEEGRGMVIDFNEETGDITVVDKQILLYRKYCTVRWPWEGLIREIEGDIE